MEILIWIGGAICLVGIAGQIWCVVTVWKTRKAGLDDAAMRASLQKVVPVNMAALFISAIGLMLVVLGIILG